MIPQEVLTAASEKAFNDGRKLLQGVRFGSTDEAHIAYLLKFMDPAPNSLWLDVGSGFGEAARIMTELRPDLSFMLVNNNEFQVAHTPPEFCTANADMHKLPFGDELFDGCMFLYSLCHADDFHAVLADAARVTNPGGKLFVFDYLRLSGDNRLMQQVLCAKALTWDELEFTTDAAGWRMQDYATPTGDDTMFRDAMADPGLYRAIFDDLRPVIWRATKR